MKDLRSTGSNFDNDKYYIWIKEKDEVVYGTDNKKIKTEYYSNKLSLQAN